MYIFWFLNFLPVFLNPPGSRTLTFQHVTRISLVQTIACTLFLLFRQRLFFRFFLHAGPKRLQPCLTITVLFYISYQVDSEPAYLRKTSKIMQDNTIEYWDSALFRIFISNVNSLKCNGHDSTLFCLDYEIANSFSQHMYGQMTLCSLNQDIINHSL